MITKKSKYNAKKIVTPEGMFDSKKELRRWMILKGREASGLIKDLERQVSFLLIDEQREPDRKGVRGGIIKGKLIEHKCSYKADFCYRTSDGDYVVEDAKGFRTPEYVIKRKLMLQRYGIRIHEV